MEQELKSKTLLKELESAFESYNNITQKKHHTIGELMDCSLLIRQIQQKIETVLNEESMPMSIVYAFRDGYWCKNDMENQEQNPHSKDSEREELLNIAWDYGWKMAEIENK